MNKTKEKNIFISKVLLIGINYTSSPNNKLLGCINDIKNIEQKIRSSYPQCANFLILKDDQPNPNLQPTRKNIINSINWLVKDLKPNDCVYLHYSGHGGLTIDLSGDEITGKDSCIYPISGKNIEIIIDDEIRNLLVDKLPENTKCIAVFDSCHSGTALDLKYTLNCNTSNLLSVSQNTRYKDSKADVIFLSGCADNQTSADTINKNNIPTGALTNALLDCWNNYGKDINFKLLLYDIRKYLKNNNYTQIPQLSFGNYKSIQNVLTI